MRRPSSSSAGDRVVEADALDEAAVAAAARVGDDDVVERALLGAAAGQSDHDHVRCSVRDDAARDRTLKCQRGKRAGETNKSVGAQLLRDMPRRIHAAGWRGRSADTHARASALHARASSSACRPWRPSSSSSASARTG